MNVARKWFSFESSYMKPGQQDEVTVGAVKELRRGNFIVLTMQLPQRGKITTT